MFSFPIDGPATGSLVFGKDASPPSSSSKIHSGGTPTPAAMEDPHMPSSHVSYQYIDLGDGFEKFFFGRSNRMLIRSEYWILLEHIKNHQGDCGGVVLTGQSGIGTNCSPNGKRTLKQLPRQDGFPVLSSYPPNTRSSAHCI